ncbi:MAG: CARDB domain-containing protein [Myxococcaceae bacterium]
MKFRWHGLLALALLSPCAFADTASGVNYLLQNQSGTGLFGEALGEEPRVASAEAVDALRALGFAGSADAAVLALSFDPGLPDTEVDLRRAGVLATTPFALPLLPGDAHALGFDASDALHLSLSLRWLHGANAARAQTAPLVTSLLSLQLPTGCFGHADEPSIEITSLAARALAGESAVANAARQSAFACLAAHQAAGGAIGDLTSTAAALLALRESPTHAVAVNAARAYLMATQLPNGSWENSVRSTALAVQAIGVSSPDWNVDTDVVGRALLLLSDSEPIQGATITASLTLSNRSAFDAPLNNVRFWAQPLAGGVPVLLATQSLPPLAAGSTTVFTAPLPTLALSGRYTLLARVDPDNITPELNELNNAAAALLNVRQENDVAVYSSGIRFTALGGSQVQVQVDIHNLGVVLPRAVDVALYRGNPTSNGTLIGTTTLAAGLATNAQATVAFTWNATSVNGPIPLYAVADASGALSEINETNNAGFRFYTPGADQPVDLNVSALTYSPQPPVKGRAFTANATVRNLSTVEATRVPVGLYEGVLLRALVEVAAIPANGSVTVALGPLNTLSATEYTAVADPHLLTADPNRANNSFSRVTGNPADEAYALSLSSVTPTVTNPAAGTSFTVSVSATNSGTDTAPTFVRLVDTTDGTTWTVMPVSLLANETTSVSLGSFTAPNHKPILRACIDPDDALDELNENDNCASFSMGPGGADLRVHSNNIRFAPYGANVGEAVSATATVRNLNNIQTTAVLEWWHGRPSFEEGQLIERSPLTLAPNASVDVALQWVRQAGAMELYARIVEVLPRDDDGDNNFAGRHLFLESIVDVGGLGIGGNEGTDVRVGRVRGLPAPEIAVAYKFGTAATTSAGVALFEPTANGHQLLWRNEALGYVGDIVLADTDNDGVGEVVYLRSNIANDFPTQVVARRADGSLKWQSPLRAAGCAYPQQLAVGDINGDAVADFAYATATHVRVLSGVDGSEIRLITLAASSTDCSGDQPIELVDVEGDGQNEIVVRDFDGTSLRMFNADGTQRWRVPTGQVIDQVAIADLDQDGFPELLRPRQRAPIIAHDLRTGAQVAISTPFESLPSAPFSVGAARQDGLPYVVIGNNGFTTTGGSFRPDLTALWETTLPSNPTDVLTGTLADLTGAGRPQWISSSFTRAFLMLDARNGTLLEGTPQQLPNVGGTPSLFNGERPPVVADVFGNGKSAIVIGKQGRGIEEWSLPNEYALYGPGQFAIFTSPHWKKQPKVWATRAHVKGRIDESLHVNSTYRWWTDHNTWNQQFDAVPAELRPDLELRQGEFVAAPAQPAAGASSTVSVTLHNVGGVAASNVRVAFYDGNPDSGGRLIGDTVLPGPLAPRTGTAVASLAWTAYPEGSHEIYAVANSDDAIVESGRENNIAFFRVLVGPAAALCDLSIDLASLATTPAVPLPGNATQLSGTVQNVGTIACTATTVELREGASTLGSVALASLAPSATANVSFSFTALPGTRLLQLVADASQVTLDSDRANNLAAFTLFVPSSTTPDLAVADFSLTPNPANPGEGVLGSVTVRNAGGLSGPVALRIRAGSSDIATTSLAPLLPGETTTFAFNLTAPTATTTLEAAIDPANALPELDETNNVASRTLTVQASELSLSCVASPASVGPGESVTFTATAVRTATTSVDVLLDATVLDAQGQAVASLASGQRRTLLTGSTAITFAWNSGNYPAGNYALDVVATAATASTGTTAGRTLARTQIPVTVTAEVLAQTALAVDRASYTPGQEVLMTQRLTNASRNASLDGALLRIFVADSTGTVLFTSLRALSSLPAGATRDTSDLFPISPDLALGTYTSRSEVLNAQGALLASAQTTWTLHYAATDIIVGTLAVPTPFPNNRALDVSAALTNNGSTPLVQGLLVVEVLNGTTLALEASASQRVDVAALGSPSFTLTVPVTGIPEGQKLFVLRLDGRILDRTLALAVQGPNDTEPPVIALTGVNDGLVTLQDVTPVFSATDQSPFTLTATLNGAAFISGTPIITEGDYTLDLAAQDIHGNASSLSVRFAIDRTPPALALTGPQDGEFSATPVTLTFDATDAHPGATTSTLDGNAIASGQSVTTEGTHVWGVTSTDAAGNVATRTVNFTLDFTDPSVRIVGVTSGAYYRTAVAPTVDAADTHLARVDVTLDGAPYVPGTPITTEGAHQLLAQAFDAAGRSASDQVSFVLDFTAPVITVHGVSDGTFVNAPPTIVFFAADAYLANVSATLDGAPFVSGDFVSLAGTHVLVVTAVDLAGNVATRTVTFTLDVTPPVVTVSGVTDGAHYRTPLAPTFSATDTHLTSVVATLNGAPFTSGGMVSAENNYVLRVTATDRAGNVTTLSVAFVIDATPPVVSISGVIDGAQGTAFTPIFGATDANLNTVTALLDGAPFISGTSVTTPGAHALVVTATDRAGNSTTRSVSFAITPTSGGVRFHYAACAFGNLQMSHAAQVTGPGCATAAAAHGTATFTNSARLVGDIVAGGSVTLKNAASVTGTAYHGGALTLTHPSVRLGASQPVAPPPMPCECGIDVEAELEAAQTTNDNARLMVPPFSQYFIDGGLHVAGATLQLPAGRYYLTALRVTTTGNITVAPDAKVTLYVGGSVELRNTARLGRSGQPAALLVVSGARASANQSVVLRNATQAWMQLYAPFADVSLLNASVLQGAVVGRNVILADAPRLTADGFPQTFPPPFTCP